MTESNTPPENQKKKSVFSRFFSRKKAPKTDADTQNGENNTTQESSKAQEQAITPSQERPIEVNNVALDNAGTSSIEQQSPNVSTASDAVNLAPDVNLNNTASLEKVNSTESTDTADKELVENRPVNETHSLTDKSLATDNPLGGDKPVVTEKPLAAEKTSAPNETLQKEKLASEPNTPDEKVFENKETAVTGNAIPDANTQENKEGSAQKIEVAEEQALKNSKPEQLDEPKQSSEPVASVDQSLTKSRNSFFQKISNVFKGSFNLDDELFDELEELLITSDIGIEASLNLVERLRTRVKKDKIQDADGVVIGLRSEIAQMLQQSEQDWQFTQKPYVILMVGVNGAGKTTTTAKIAKHFQDQGKSVMLAAADTFRAAAVEQLQEWGQRLDIPVIAQAHGADAAAVAHDALTSAIARDVDILMIDTAGRLHTQSDLMEQLTKVNRVLAKIDPTMPHEVMQVLDSGTGQNALTQLEHFQKAVGVSSICLSKLDGSAKGGIAISLSEKTKLPIRFIGTGEGFNDLQRFSAQQFADSLIPSLK